MAKGTESKTILFSKIMENFPNAFWEEQGKILRVPMEENGAIVEIKVTLTAAKNLLGSGEVPSAFAAPPSTISVSSAFMSEPEPVISAEPTQEEKDNVRKLMETFGL